MGMKNHTTGEMTDGAVGTGTRVEIEVQDPDSGLVQALAPPAEDPPVPFEPKLADRLFYRVFMPELIDGVPSNVSIGSDHGHLDATALGVTGAQITAFKIVLKAMHTKARTAKNLT